jgi:polar amino acid transport system ATP-binding protein
VAADDNPIVRIVRSLRKRFGDNEVLKGIDLEVRAGEVVAIIGKSGSGKSTLLRCINGLEGFQQGELEVDGQALKQGDAKAMRALRQHVGMIFQSFNLFPHLSVGRNVMLAPTLVKKAGSGTAAERVRASCSNASAWPRSSRPGPTSCRAASSSAWPSRARWPCSPA